MKTTECQEHPATSTGTMVNVIIGEEKPIASGKTTVAELKKLGGVPPTDALEQVVCGKLELLDDNKTVTITGNEVFVAHPRDSGSS